jgi:hypothetical protein
MVLPMHPRSRFLFLIPLTVLLACGSTPTPPTTDSTSLNLTGDWVALALPNPSIPGMPPTPVSDFLGALQSSNGSVTGTLRAISLSQPQCVSFNQDLAATGTIDTNNNLKLAIPISGGTATITATIAVAESYTNATWQITGGTCAMPATTISIAEFAPMTGTYTGALDVFDVTTGLPIAGSGTNVTAVLTQSTTPNADGQFPITGTITAPGVCPGVFPISEIVAGGVFVPLLTPASPEYIAGGSDPTATTLNVDFLPPPTCSAQIFTGTLIRQ